MSDVNLSMILRSWADLDASGKVSSARRNGYRTEASSPGDPRPCISAPSQGKWVVGIR